MHSANRYAAGSYNRSALLTAQGRTGKKEMGEGRLQHELMNILLLIRMYHDTGLTASFAPFKNQPKKYLSCAPEMVYAVRIQGDGCPPGVSG